jgi:hypothetical protein
MENKEIEALILRDKAAEQLARIKDIETGIPYLNKVKAIEVWAKAEKKDAKLQNLIAEQKLRTQRILGKLIREGQERGELAKKNDNQYSLVVSDKNNQKTTLPEIGLTRKESSTFQTIASMPEEEFEKEIAIAKQESDMRVELTTARVLRAAKRMEEAKEISRESDPIFNEVDKLLLKVGDKLQYIIQGDYIPQTASDYSAIESIRHHMYRFVRLAGQFGVNINEVWEKTAARHGIKMQLPEHLKQKINNSDMNDAEIIND